MADIDHADIEQMRKAIVATRANHQRDTDQQIRMLWTAISREDREDALAIAAGEAPPNFTRKRQQHDQDERKRRENREPKVSADTKSKPQRDAHRADPTNPNNATPSEGADQ